jgi:hypothetical protein
MCDYVIAIPSYGRPLGLQLKTLKMLRENGISASKIYIFVVGEQYDLYEKALVADSYNCLVIGEPGITAQRRFIRNFFDKGQHVVSFDDDIESIDLSLTHWKNLDRFIEDAFLVCLDKKATLWGIYPTYNRFFREKRPGVNIGLNFIIGHTYGFINNPDKEFDTNPLNTQKEDYENTIKHYIHAGKVIRFDRVAAQTKYMGNAGGLGKRKDRLAAIEADAKRFCEEYPLYTKLKQRKNGQYEVKLCIQKKETMHSVSNIAREEPLWLDALDPKEIQPLWEALEKIQIPFQAGSSGRAASFGKHRACTFGLIKPRGKKEFCLTAASKRFPAITKMIYDLGKKICKVPFTSIHCNVNVCCPPHLDPVNSKDSTIISFGNYEGLLLEIDNLGVYDVFCKPLQFNGALYKHWNTPYVSGKKYSLVFFYHENPEKIDSENGLKELIEKSQPE